MLKLIGIIILVISGGCGGYAAACRFTKKALFLKQYAEFISNINTQIRFTGYPLSEILKNYSASAPLGVYITKCCELLKQYSFPEAWEQTFKTCAKDVRISKEEEKMILNFGLHLGESDTEGQIKHCEYNHELTQPYLNHALEDKKTKGKLALILGTCLGLALGLMFI